MPFKTFGVVAGVAALLAATSASPAPKDGHFEWRSSAQAPGPRAPIAAPRRVWVSSPAATSDAGACMGMMVATTKADAMPCCRAQSS
jgi:hypothetical protein